MKTRSLIVAAAVALIAVSCSPKVSDKTTITGDLGANAPESVELSIKTENSLQKFQLARLVSPVSRSETLSTISFLTVPLSMSP